MNRRFTQLLLTATMMLTALPLSAQNARQDMKPAQTNHIVDMNLAVNNKQQTTEFGRRLVERLKAEGRKLPLPEETMLRLKPARRSYVRPVAAGEKPLTFSGMLQYNEVDGRMLLEYGFYKFSQKNGFKREIMANVSHTLNGRGAYYNHKLHGTSSITIPSSSVSNWVYCEWDEDTWEPTGNHGAKIGNELIAKCADWDPVTQKCYAWQSTSTSRFQTIDYEKQSREIIASSDSAVVMLAFTNEGQLYGVTENGSFCSIDKTNGHLTYIATLDFPFVPVFESMTCDRRTNRLYLTATEFDEDTEEMGACIREIDVTTGKTTLLGYLPEVEEYTCLNVLHEPDEEAPAAIEQMMVSFVSEGVAGVVGFTIPTKTVGGEPLEGDVHYVITYNDDDDNAIEGDAKAGDYVPKMITPKSEGRQKLVVVLSKGDAVGQRNVAISWLGKDTPKATSVEFAYDETTGTADLRWKGNVGQHGGRVSEELTYDVYRFPGGQKVAADIATTSFSETLTNLKYDGHYYKVVAKSGDTEYEPTLSNIIFTGAAYEVPFTDDFESTDPGYKYTIIDANNDNHTWDFVNFSSTGGRMRYDLSKENTADDWALTPPIHLMEGIAYQISFKANSIAKAYKERLAVACGMGDDPTAYELIIPETEVSTTNHSSENVLTGEIKVKQTGDYRFGFHCTSPRMQNALMIDDVAVTAGLLLITPDSVKNLKLTPADEGDLIVTIDFDAPSMANDGTPLQSLSRIEIKRGEQLDDVTTLTDVVPGQHYTYVDEDALNGQVLYTVTAFNEAGAGFPATASVYVGTDAPGLPVNVALADNLNGTATLSWEAPVNGQHGGYVDTDEVTYNIYSVVNNALQAVKEGVSDMTYTVNGIPQTGAQGQTLYGVSAVNELGESNVATAAPLIYGAPYTLPYMEGFKTAGLNGIWSTRSNQVGVNWNLYTGMSADGDNCITAIEAEQQGVVASLTSGKISLAGAVTPKLVFSAFGDPGTNNQLKVAIQKNGEAKADTLLTIDYQTVEVEDFVTYAIDLSNYKDSKYINVSFVAQLNDKKLRFLMIDDVNVRNVNTYDLAAYADMQSRTTAGQTAKMDVTVHNVGETAVEGYTVSFYVNGEQVKTFDQTTALQPFSRANYSYVYTTSATDAEKSKVWATVDYQLDLDEDNNTTPEQELIIVASQLESVENLVATTTDNNSTQLTWTPVSGKNSVVESFEGYETFTQSFGSWGNFDQDKAATAGINGLWWPGANQPLAFMVFDFRKAGVTEAQMNQNPQFEANSGQQFLACFKANNASGNKNNDWLVSPELSGNEQTIQIYAQSLAGIWNETFEVLYSTTGNQVTDFKSDNLIDEYEAPKNYFGRFRASLPAGAKYFAIHCNSQNGGIFMLDDISYEGKQLTLKGYNIYCDNQLVATADANASAYEHSTAKLSAGLHTYHVTAVYEEGESKLSNAAPVAVVNAIRSVDGERISISGNHGCIAIEGVTPVSVYTLAGQLVFKGMSNGKLQVKAHAGQYLVKTGAAVTNVLVK